MTISVIENMKCSLLSQQQSENWGTGEASRSRGTGAEVTFSTHAEQEPGSWASSHTGCKGKVEQMLECSECCGLSAVQRRLCPWSSPERGMFSPSFEDVFNPRSISHVHPRIIMNVTQFRIRN